MKRLEKTSYYYNNNSKHPVKKWKVKLSLQ